MNNQHERKVAITVIRIVFVVAVFFIGRNIGETRAYQSINMGNAAVSGAQFEPFWKVWNTLTEKYVAATTTDTQQRIWGAISGLANSQGDPYTVFFPPEESKGFKNDISGNFEGVGMEIGIKDGVLTVVAPIKDSPAARADVRTGDKIVKINDTVTNDLSVDKAVKMIRGDHGTSVKITFIREGAGQPLEKTLIRDVINIPTLETEIKSNIFIIRLFSFTSQSPELFRVALREFLQSGKNRLIIDLRGNPGGYLDAAWDIASWFMPSGKTIVTEDFGGKGENKIYRSKGYDVLNKFFGTNYKVIVLVDGGSASAAEILAGALREQGVAQLVGTKTFGKGSVQELVEITPETTLKVTIARWLTPNGHNLSHDGLEPDIEVKLTAKDIETKNDLQLGKAIEILSK